MSNPLWGQTRELLEQIARFAIAASLAQPLKVVGSKSDPDESAVVDQ